MKLKKLSRTYLMIVQLSAMVIGFGLPRDANAVTCYYEGYVVQMVQTAGPLVTVWFRERPIDAGQYITAVIVSTPGGEGMANTLRSAYQNNTKVGIGTTWGGATCPTYDLSMPGWFSLGTINVLLPNYFFP